MKKLLNKNIIFSTIIGLLATVLLLYKIYPSFTQNNNPTVNIPPVKDDLVQKSIISETKIDESFFDSMDEKELIHYKLLNSVDFFSSVEGEFNTFNIFFSNSTVTYAIDIKNNKSHITTKEDQQDLDYIYNNGIAIELNNIEKIYRNIQCVYDENALSNINAQLNVINEEDDITANITNKDLNKLKPRQRYDYTGGLLHRNNELFHDSEISIFSQAVMGYNMSDYAKWDIEGEETLLDRPCTKIHGNLNNIDKLTHSETFTAWIDKETGVVLKYYEEDGNGKHTSGFETTHINYNNTLDENMFIINYDEYSEKTFPGR